MVKSPQSTSVSLKDTVLNAIELYKNEIARRGMFAKLVNMKGLDRAGKYEQKINQFTNKNSSDERLFEILYNDCVNTANFDSSGDSSLGSSKCLKKFILEGMCRYLSIDNRKLLQTENDLISTTSRHSLFAVSMLDLEERYSLSMIKTIQVKLKELDILPQIEAQQDNCIELKKYLSK